MSAKLFYIIGASGSGKDSLLGACQKTLKSQCNTVILQRYITRAEGPGEDHVPLSPRLFEQQQQAGEFALYWEANGYHYGIGIELDNLLARGVNVLVNGSRQYLAQAKSLYPHLIPVVIRVEERCLRQRLIARGRENEAQIEARILRNREMAQFLPKDAVYIDNSTTLSVAADELVTLLQQEVKRK